MSTWSTCRHIWEERWVDVPLGLCAVRTKKPKLLQPSNTFGLLATISLRRLDYRRQEIGAAAAETMFRAALVCSHYHAPAERLPSSEPTLLRPTPFVWPPSQDPFKYSYPPLPDDDFQTPICDNGPIVSEDEAESKDGESEVKDALESSFSSEVAVKPKKVRFSFRAITGA